MTIYYLQVLQPISIELDSDINYYHHYKVDDIIEVYMYSDKGPRVRFGFIEYDAIFTYQWDSIKSKRYTIASLLSLKYVVDVTKSIKRNAKLKQLGI